MPTLVKGVFYDGPLSSPVEIEGSGKIQVDQITTSFTLTRNYAVLKSSYLPPLPGFNTYNDYQYGSAYFITETVDRIEGGLVFFTRQFSSVPPSRIEQRLIAFTYPGRSGPTGPLAGPTGWSPYAVAGPKTRNINAQVLYTYILVPKGLADPGPLFTPVIQPTIVTYSGKQVDFTGPVYVNNGNVSLPGNKQAPSYIFQGNTIPADLSVAIPYIVSVEQRRFLGPIWEQAVVQLVLGVIY